MRITRAQDPNESDKTLALKAVQVYTSSAGVAVRTLPPVNKETLLIFVKHYDTAAEKAWYCGYFVADQNCLAGSLLPILNSFMGQSPDQQLLIYSEQVQGQ